ncbi:branched-chain amino acid ABC transporter permease [Paraburkholderia sp. 40]|uniref:branched-chain amino acid ABC transporter permease n=1 Tax=Paraburkholderia sp. 40 TaxID=2991059 RepID=UPI003D1AF9F6
MSGSQRSDAGLLALLVLFVAGAIFMPSWLMSLAAVALARSLVAFGLLLLLRAGLVPFGNALYYCMGGYVAGLGTLWLGVRDTLALLLLAGVVAGFTAFVVGFLMRRYRGIFFAMLSMALSMILYGVLLKSQSLGSTDGFSVARASFFTMQTAGLDAIRSVYLLTAVLALLTAWGISRYLQTAMGHVGPAIRHNEVRVEYLGYSARRLIHIEYTASGVFAGCAGALVAILVGQVDPGMGFWMTSGEFVFIAILAGAGGVWGSLAAAFVLEAIHAMAFEYAPQYWKFVLGATLLLLIVRFPSGLSSILPGTRKVPA